LSPPKTISLSKRSTTDILRCDLRRENERKHNVPGTLRIPKIFGRERTSVPFRFVLGPESTTRAVSRVVPVDGVVTQQVCTPRKMGAVSLPRWIALAAIACLWITLGATQAAFHAPHDFIFTSANHTDAPAR
jgi:hypothetical protein